MSTKLSAFSLAIVISSLAIVNTSFAQKIIDFAYAGEGCPANSVDYVFDRKNNVLTVSFDEYSVWVSGDFGDDNKSSACTLSFIVKVPNGWNNGQISMNKVEYLGFIDTEDSVSGQLRRTYKYDWNRPISRITNFRYGEVDDFWIVDDFNGWSVCSDQVTVNAITRIRLNGEASGDYYNELVVDTVKYGSKTTVKFWFSFLPC